MKHLLDQLNCENYDLKQQLALQAAEIKQLRNDLSNREKPVFLIDFPIYETSPVEIENGRTFHLNSPGY